MTTLVSELERGKSASDVRQCAMEMRKTLHGPTAPKVPEPAKGTSDAVPMAPVIDVDGDDSADPKPLASCDELSGVEHGDAHSNSAEAAAGDVGEGEGEEEDDGSAGADGSVSDEPEDME